MSQAPKPDWPLLNLLALEPQRFGRVLAGLGFDRITPPLPRGGVPDFAPAYRRLRPWQARLQHSDTAQAKGWRAGAWTADAFAAWDRGDAADRAAVAEINRAMARAPCRLCIRDDPREAVWLAEDSGEWRSVGGGAFGDDLASLAAFLWRCRYGQAGWRIARLCGLAQVPALREGAQAA